jgi:hypothetical protein
MTRIPIVIATLILFPLVKFSFAKEPGWTEEERAAKSTAIFDGRVMSLNRVGDR